MKRRIFSLLITIVCISLFACLNSCTESDDDDDDVLEVAKLLIEHNSTDEDTGFQGFADGEPWNKLTMTGPGGEQVLTATPQGGLLHFGLTEFFFETSEPENAEIPINDVLARLPEGDYTYTGDIIEGGDSSVTTTFSHKIPSGPVLLTPIDGATEVDPDSVIISWEKVTTAIDGSSIDIDTYQVIVEKDEEPVYPQGFARAVCSIHLPATVTSVMIPPEIMEDDACYKYEVLAIEKTGNQAISGAEFETGDGCEDEESEGSETPQMVDAKLLIEHNSTDRDTGFQGFADGDPWNQLMIVGPESQSYLTVNALGGLYDFGLTEMFFETNEPENDEESIASVLSRLPEGTYTFTGEMVGGESSSVSAIFTHIIPAGPVLTSPANGTTGVDPNNTIVSWESVTENSNGGDVTIVGYQVIVEELEDEDVGPQYPDSFAKSVFSIYLPATTTSVKIPAAFMEATKVYEFEVLAIEMSGNQTLSSGTFTTQ